MENERRKVRKWKGKRKKEKGKRKKEKGKRKKEKGKRKSCLGLRAQRIDSFLFSREKWMNGMMEKIKGESKKLFKALGSGHSA